MPEFMGVMPKINGNKICAVPYSKAVPTVIHVCVHGMCACVLVGLMGIWVNSYAIAHVLEFICYNSYVTPHVLKPVCYNSYVTTRMP